MNRWLQRRLAARAETRQVDLIDKADRAANRVDREIAGVWRELLVVLRPGKPVHEVHQKALAVLRSLHTRTQANLADSLTRITHWGHKRTRENLVKTIPLDYLLVAVGKGAAHDHPSVFGRSAGLVPPATARLPASLPSVFGPQRLGEARSHRSRMVAKFQLNEADLPLPTPGAIELLLNQMGLQAPDVLAPLREPVDRKLTDEDKRELVAEILFPPPSASKVEKIVYGSHGGVDWRSRLANATRFASPEQIAQSISTGYAAGATQAQIANHIRPIVQNVRSSARRIARTEGMRVAGQVQEEMHDQLGDLVIGQQIHATLDLATRPWHARRHGTIYYSHPAPGQKGPDQMPHPPEEARDPNERPAGTPHMAWN